MIDPDFPHYSTGQFYLHWLVTNIPVRVLRATTSQSPSNGFDFRANGCGRASPTTSGSTSWVSSDGRVDPESITYILFRRRLRSAGPARLLGPAPLHDLRVRADGPGDRRAAAREPDEVRPDQVDGLVRRRGRPARPGRLHRIHLGVLGAPLHRFRQHPPANRPEAEFA